MVYRTQLHKEFAHNVASRGLFAILCSYQWQMHIRIVALLSKKSFYEETWTCHESN